MTQTIPKNSSEYNQRLQGDLVLGRHLSLTYVIEGSVWVCIFTFWSAHGSELLCKYTFLYMYICFLLERNVWCIIVQTDALLL